MKYRYRLCFFRPMDADAVERYLGRMARKGWFLDKTGQMFWRFHRGEPAVLTYAVTYFPEASIYGGPMTSAQEELAEYCAAAGWEYVAQWLRMQIYVTDQTDPVPLETDEKQKLETIRAVFQKHRLSYVLLLALYLLQCLMQGYTFSQNPMVYLASPGTLLTLTAWPVLTLLMMENLLVWAIWLRWSKRSVEQGGPCISSVFRVSRGIEIGLAAVMAVLFLQTIWYTIRSGNGTAVLWMLGVMAVFLLLTFLPIWWMRERGFSESQIRGIISVIAVVFAVVVIVYIASRPLFTPIEPAWWYEGEDGRYGIYEDPIPFRLENIGVSTEGLPYSTSSRRFTRSPLLAITDADHSCPPAEELPGEQPEIEYTMVHVSFSPLYDLCRQELMRSWLEWTAIEDHRWQAEEVYAATTSEGTPVLLICWEKDLLLIYSDLLPQLTAEQASAIREVVTTYWE